LLEDLLLKPDHSLIDQSLHAKLGAVTTNGDGFGIGWFDAEDTPGTYHSVEPAWNDRNLKELARHISSPLVFAHVRASTGGAIQQTNCHPFRHGRWLWMHNGQLREFDSIKRELAFAIEPSLYPSIEGSTDSELFFYLALSLGLEDDPPSAVERAVGFIEATGHAQGIEHPIKMSVATTNGGDPACPIPGASRATQAIRRNANSRLGATQRSCWRLERGAGIHLRRRWSR
jgi:glutamine amidotransferase